MLPPSVVNAKSQAVPLSPAGPPVEPSEFLVPAPALIASLKVTSLKVFI